MTSVQRQLVNGFNYHIILSQNITDCRAEAIIYASFQGSPSESSFSNTCLDSSIDPNVDSTTDQILYSEQRPLAGGYTVQKDPSGS